MRTPTSRNFFLFSFWVPMLIAFALVTKLDKNLKGKKLWFPVALVLGVPFIILDVLYNWIFGTIIWLELPREFLYTTRLKRKKAGGHEEAFRQCKILNKYDPGHC